MSDAVLGFFGVVVGALAALFGTYYTTKAERRRIESARNRQVRTASRAWREDFYAVQSVILERLQLSTRRSSRVAIQRARGTELPPPLATDEHLLLLADTFNGYGSWTRVTRTRREIARFRRSSLSASAAELAVLFVEIDKGRQALSSVDPDWPFDHHSGRDVVLPLLPFGTVVDDPPGTYDE